MWNTIGIRLNMFALKTGRRLLRPLIHTPNKKRNAWPSRTNAPFPGLLQLAEPASYTQRDEQDLQNLFPADFPELGDSQELN